MAKTQILEYTIYLRDPAVVASLQASIAAGTPPVMAPSLAATPLVRLPTGGYGLALAPYYAGINGDLAVGGDGVPPLPQIETGQAIPQDGPGYLRSGWFNTSNDYPRNLYTFEKSTGWWIFGHTTTFIWGGRVAQAPGLTIALPPGDPQTGGVPANELLGFTQRLWVHGQELPYDGEQGGVGGSGSPVLTKRCPAASRTGDGFGQRNVSSGIYSSAYDEYVLGSLRPAVTDCKELWQRVYLRPLRFGSTTVRFWKVIDSVGNKGFSLALTSTGQVALFLENPLTLVHAFGQTVAGQWTRIDCLAHLTGTTSASIEVRLNGVPLGSAAYTAVTPDAGRVWSVARLGGGAHDAAGDHEFDLDDWVAARTPITASLQVAAWSAATAYVVGTTVRVGAQTYYATAPSTNQAPSGATTAFWQLLADPSDLAQGSHLVRVAPDGFGPSHNAAWVGDVRILQQRVLGFGTGPQKLTCSTASALVEVTLPLATVVDTLPASLGWVALRVVLASTRGTTSGTLGYQIGAASAVATAITENTLLEYEAMTGTIPTGVPHTGETLRLRYAKGADAGAGTCAILSATLELVGQFGPEDVPPGAPAVTFPREAVVHQTQHPWSPWARDVLPLGPVLIVGGTYVGNGTGRDLTFKLPPAWLLIRQVATSNTPHRWWPSLLGSHDGAGSTINLEGSLVMHHDRDPSFVPTGPDADQQLQFRVRLGGGNVRTNQTGLTYQYCALLDPAGRFSRAFATAVRQAGSTSVPGVPRVWALDDPTFLPDAAFVLAENVTVSVTPASVWKTPAHGVDDAEQYGGAAIPNALTFGTGTLTVRAGLVGAQESENLAAILFRRNDGNASANGKVLFTGTYTGDGAASRTITFGTTGRRPLYAAIGFFDIYHRDPSHTTNTSTLATGSISLATTAITGGGPDSFTVGSTLNSNGTVYGYWGLYGDTVAGNGGWSGNGEFAPVPADSANPPGWTEPEIIEPGDGNGGGEPEPEPDDGLPTLEDDLASCPVATTKLVNLALARLGINQGIADLATDVSAEATAVRLAYDETLLATLREFPWAFATAYADPLVLVAGTVTVPAAPDWQYAYRQPADCVYARRLVRSRATWGIGRAFDPSPPDFRVGQDAGGFLLYANEPDAVLEYTRRLVCPSARGEALFRSAWAWRLAHELAPALARLPDRTTYCWEQYHFDLRVAATKNTGEVQQPPDGLPDWIRGR